MGSQASKPSSNIPPVRTLPTLVEPIFNADQSPRPLRILCIDGAGIRSYSSLVILQQLIARLPNHYERDSVCPAEVFDLIVGTGAGGIIALMLGRLKMSVPDCMSHFQAIMLDLLSRGGLLSTGSRLLRGHDITWLSSSDLKAHAKRIISLQLGDPDALLLEASVENNVCKTAVVATEISGSENSVILRSYDLQCGDSNEEEALRKVYIWEAAHATSATPLIFEPIRIGGGNRYVDGAVGGHSNPAQLALDEVRRVWPDHPIGLFLSLGAGTLASTQRGLTESGSLFDKLGASAALVDKSTQERIGTDFAGSLYVRFCPGAELASIGIGDHMAISGNHNLIRSITLSYLLQPQEVDKLAQCIKAMDMCNMPQSSGPWEVFNRPPDTSLEISSASDPSESSSVRISALSNRRREFSGLPDRGIITPAPTKSSSRNSGIPGENYFPARSSVYGSVANSRIHAGSVTASGYFGGVETGSASISFTPPVPQPQAGSYHADFTMPPLRPLLGDSRNPRVTSDPCISLCDSPPNPFGSSSISTSSPVLLVNSNLTPTANPQGQVTGTQLSEIARPNPQPVVGTSDRAQTTKPQDNIIPTGTYQLTNVKSENEAALEDGNQATTLVGASSDCDFAKVWNVERLSNGKYTIKCVQHSASIGHDKPKLDGSIFVKREPKQWVIEASNDPKTYTIKCTEDDLYWGLIDSESKTPITLREGAKDKKNHWRFEHATIPDLPGKA